MTLQDTPQGRRSPGLALLQSASSCSFPYPLPVPCLAVEG